MLLWINRKLSLITGAFTSMSFLFDAVTVASTGRSTSNLPQHTLFFPSIALALLHLDCQVDTTESWRQHWQPHTIQQVFETFANYLKCPEKLSEFVLEPIHSGWNPLELAALKALSQGSRIWPSSAQKRVKVEIAKQAKLQAHGDMPLASCHATFVGGRYHQMSLCCQCSGAFHLAGQSL